MLATTLLFLVLHTPAPELLPMPKEEDPRPPVSDVLRLPTRDFIVSQYALAECYRSMSFDRWYASKTSPERYREWCYQAYEDGRHCWAVWDILDDLTRDYNDETKRDLLDKLKIRVGHDAYYSGAWGPAVPYWRVPYRDE